MKKQKWLEMRITSYKIRIIEILLVITVFMLSYIRVTYKQTHTCSKK